MNKNKRKASKGVRKNNYEQRISELKEQLENAKLENLILKKLQPQSKALSNREKAQIVDTINDDNNDYSVTTLLQKFNLNGQHMMNGNGLSIPLINILKSSNKFSLFTEIAMKHTAPTAVSQNHWR